MACGSVGSVSNQLTMKAKIKLLRRRNKVSQAVFAAYLNTTSSSVQQWEQGKKSPNGTSLKLLNLVDKKGLDILA